MWCTVIILDPLADIIKMVRKPKIKAGFQVRPDVQKTFFFIKRQEIFSSGNAVYGNENKQMPERDKYR